MDETIRTAAISPLRQRSIDDMNVRRFSRATQHNYIRDVGRFATFLGRSPDTATAGTRGAVAGAIDLAAVATTTDQRLSVAFRTQEQPGRRRGAVTGSADIPWTSAMIPGILTPHACPARCEARRRT